ncbi:aminopeptidase N-like [Schistocerca serialis cubense]|uniref:aminopeptidase N-like n=1 Tax=Schistocerca serialis cubense TaxID=2023355 RepID=UPI00214E1DB4|nr:aminopeptidase N-like [Schistocerca serialis cubense]
MKMGPASVAAVVLLALAAPAHAQRKRLPGESLPHSYHVTITPDLDEGDVPFHYNGSNSIFIDVLRNTTTFTLHSSVTVTSLNVTINRTTIGSSYEQLQDGSNFLVITLEREVFAGDRYILRMEFNGEIRDGLDGFYRSSYEEDGETRWLAATQFAEMGARMTMPCYDEPAIKATWMFTFRPRPRWTVLTNTPLITSRDEEDGRRTMFFAETPLMSAFLLAWVISDFVGVHSPLEQNMTVWTTMETESQAEYASSVAPWTVASMAGLVNVPYNHGYLSKLDHVALPELGPGAMENWGLITYKQSRLLALENYTSESVKEQVVTIIQHEVSHQWFGNLVSPNWWSVLWLSEGFATFFENFAAAVVEPTWRLDEVFVVSTLLRPGMVYDEIAEAPPLTSENYDSNIYYKGGSIIRMMQQFIGSEAFYEGLHNYLVENQFSNATDDILFAAMDAVAPASSLRPNASVSSVMLPWARQSGFPFLTVTRNYVDGSAVITQNRWLLPPDPQDQALWTIPVTYTSRSEADFSTSTRLWLSDKAVWIDSLAGATADDWVLFNLQVAGFYRVQYDDENWELLREQLLTDHEAIPAVNRAQLVDDALSLVLNDQMSVETFLNLTSYLGNEYDYIAWLEGDYVFTFLYSMMDTNDFCTLSQTLVANVTAALGYEADPEDSHVTRILRATVARLACDGNQTECRNTTFGQFERYMADPNDTANWVDPDMKSVVYCEGIRQGGAEAYDFLQELYQNTSVISEQSVILEALTCQEDPSAFRYLLEQTARRSESGVHWDHLPALLEAALRGRRKQAAAAAIDFFVDNPHIFKARGIGKKKFGKLLTSFTRNLCDEDIIHKISLLASSLGDHPLASAASWRRSDVPRCDAIRRDASHWLKNWMSGYVAT